ncbi:MAG: type II toxin-antitoxin system HicB family antitoxin [Dehalococcoidia bacterium]
MFAVEGNGYGIINSLSKNIGGKMQIEIDQETDNRWIAEVPELPGVMVYGESRSEAISKAQTLALRVIADRLEHGEEIPELRELFAVAS